MTADELVETLAGSLELLASQLDALLGPDWDRVHVARILAHLRDQAREAAALAAEPRDDFTEELVLALRAVENDWRLGRGLGLEPALHRLTWDRVKLALRRAGQPCED